MTKKIAWITDSTAYIPDDLKNNPDVYVIPLGIVFGNNVFDDGIDLTTEELYRRIREEKDIPKTSQPPIGKFAELFEKLSIDYDCAIAIHVSDKLSGTLACCTSASDSVPLRVEVIDSKSMSYAITTLLYKGIELAEQGIDCKDIAVKLRQEADKSENYIVLGSLEQFYKGGRMTGTQYLLGSLLRIKPIIRINSGGAFELFERVRSEKKAYLRMIELFKHAYHQNNIKQLQIMHGNVRNKAEAFKQDLLSQFPGLDIVIGEISSAIAVHAGEGTLAVIWHNEEK
ncbi:DegV family protein [Paenibacillus profundus]|uniref:DegV family protein n=1 Tax=Paenibacillus profundus TaxID=1173085 RepID=A0ABS8YBN1_9BACL|nr:DegV family protein [Paenibacillus profundus]MCE5168372.1 DegV family protein [Paenibacillus profundus]